VHVRFCAERDRMVFVRPKRDFSRTWDTVDAGGR